MDALDLRQMTTLRVYVVVLAVSVLPSACGVFDRADIVGRIVEITGDEVLVELDVEHPDIGNDARVSLRLVEQHEKRLLSVGDRISIWIEPGVEDSDPPGVSATRITIAPE